MTNLSVYINYFRTLAVAHQQLKHNPDSETGDTAVGSQHFLRISIEDVVTNLRTKVGFPCLMIEMYETITEAQQVYDIRQKPKGAFMVVSHPVSKNFKDEQGAYDASEQIVFDILQQIWKDHYAPGVNRCSTPFKDFGFDKLIIVPVGPVFDGEFGWRVEFEFDFHKTNDIAKAPADGTFIF